MWSRVAPDLVVSNPTSDVCLAPTAPQRVQGVCFPEPDVEITIGAAFCEPPLLCGGSSGSRPGVRRARGLDCQPRSRIGHIRQPFGFIAAPEGNDPVIEGHVRL